MARTADYIRIAEGIRSNEVSSRQKIEHLNSEISGIVSKINRIESQISNFEARISAEMSRPTETDSEGNTYGGPDYSYISSLQAEINGLDSEADSLRVERSNLESERDVERGHLQEILIEKSATFVEVQSKAQDAAASVAAAGGMIGAYSGIGANLANSFQNAHSNLAQAAGILGGSVTGTVSGGGGGGGAGRSAAGIRGVPSQTRNMSVGMTINGHGGGVRAGAVSSARPASGACRGMSTNGTARRSSTAGVYRTAQTGGAGTVAFGLATAASASSAGASSAGASFAGVSETGTPTSGTYTTDIPAPGTQVLNASRYGTSKSPVSANSFVPSSGINMNPVRRIQTKHKTEIDNKSEKIDAIINDMNEGSGTIVTRDEAQKICNTIIDFSGPFYTEIRNAYNNPKAESVYKNQIELLDKYIKSSPKWKGIIYRGINVDKKTSQKILSEEFIDMLGPSSWSSDEYVAREFANDSEEINIVFVLANNESGASINHLSQFGRREHEVTVPSGVLYSKERVENRIVNGEEFLYVYVTERT